MASPDPILIVTGAHLRAEAHDRPIAYGLRAALIDRLGGEHAPGAVPIVVCSDLWMLNQPELQSRPTIAVGGPDVNALAASLADRLPSVFVVDGRWMVQMALDDRPLACCWGVSPADTARAVQTFMERFAGDFLDACDRTL